MSHYKHLPTQKRLQIIILACTNLDTYHLSEKTLID